MDKPAIMAITVLGGLLSATLSLLHLFSLPGLVFISYLAPLPLFLIGLSIGLRPLYGAALIATLLVLLLEGPVFGAEFFVFSALGPAFLINRALLNRKKSSKEVAWYPSSFLLRDLTLASGIVMVLALGIYLYLTQGSDVHTLMKTLLKTLDPQGHLKDAEPLLIKLFPFLPGFFALSWGVMMLINGTLAQGVLVRFKQNLRPSPSLEDLNTPGSFLILLGLSILLSWVGVGSLELLGKSATCVLILPFFLVGLGVVHKWIHKTPFAMVGLIIFYFLLLLFLWPALFVILAGILKPWIEKR
jgi:hypothetical protein